MSNKKKILLIIGSGILIIIGIIIGLFVYYNSHTVEDTTLEISKDNIAPTITLSAESNDNGDYFINLIREIETDEFDPMSLVKSVNDNISIAENITIECNDVLDISKSTQYISYIITDENGNTNTTRLLIIYSDDPDKVRAEQQSQIAEMKEEIAKLEAEEKARLEEEARLQKEAEERAKKEQETNKNTESAKPQNNNSQTSTPKPQVQVYHNVNNFTVYGTGNLQADLQSGAIANCSYGGCGGVLGAYSFDMNGNTVTIHWTCTCGWTGTSTATIQ